VVQGTTLPAFHFFQFLSNDDGRCLKDDFGRSKIYIIDHNPSWKKNQRQKKREFLDPRVTNITSVNHIRCFAIDIAKVLILLSCRLTMKRLCVLQLETALATLVTTWFTLADRRSFWIRELQTLHPEGKNKQA
jgi:hypothetical protein